MKDKIKPKINLFFVTVVHTYRVLLVGVCLLREFATAILHTETFHPAPPIYIGDTRTPSNLFITPTINVSI